MRLRGWKDGSATADNAGAISYDIGGPSVQRLGTGVGAAGTLAVGNAFKSTFSSAKTYSINAETSTGVVLEFDLSRFIGLVGGPDAVEVANLMLDAPKAKLPKLPEH